MEPIHDSGARTVGWLEGDTAFGDDGRPVAFLSGGSVFAAASGRRLGAFDAGVFRDGLGCIVAALAGAGPSSRGRPMRGTPAPPLLNRSRLDWGRFVAGQEAQWPWETRL